jgi:DNA modification methylase
MTQHQNMPSRANLAIEYLATTSLTPDPKNARKHSARQIGKLARIIADYGWSSPIVTDEERVVIAGHARLAAAKSLGMIEVPCVRLAHLSAAQKKALAIADNAMTDASNFDDRVLREVLLELTDLNFDMELTGLEMGVIDFVIDGGSGEAQSDPADIVAAPDHASRAVSQSGDQWQLGQHRLLCGNALDPLAYEHLLGDDRAAMVFSDPPYNVPIDGHVSGLGRHRHREFAMASSEMTVDEFRKFLAGFMRLLCAFSKNGAIHYICIDWGHVRTMLEAGDGIYAEVKNICVWNKSNAGMGSLYRSKHELIVVFKNGAAPHVNNVALGKHGRHRTNVWDYAGANAFGATRDSDLAAHPTVKPIALVADAMRDCSNRDDIILDPFMGSGTTILAAERSGRRGFGIEIDPHYVDTAVRRWQTATGKLAILGGDGRTFEAIEKERPVPEPSVEGEA